jgi:hypothetical protein
MSKAVFTAKKSASDGSVRICADLATGWYGPHVKIQASATISTAEARALAAELIALSDAADAKMEKKKATDARRQKWREREIAACRMRSSQ